MKRLCLFFVALLWVQSVAAELRCTYDLTADNINVSSTATCRYFQGAMVDPYTKVDGYVLVTAPFNTWGWGQGCRADGECTATVSGLRSGTRAANGFQALAELDTNGDGVIDHSDAAWASLLLWTDRNHDGISSGDEIENLAETNVVALETSYRSIGRRDEAGNIFPYMATLHVIKQGQALRQSYFDVYLRVGP